jgi:predicted adenylyl cyclase CyaB
MQDELPVKSILKEYLGVRGVVKKKRELYLYENVRIHLDTVKGLGKFLEFEIVCSNLKELKDARRKMKMLKKVFDVSAKNLISISYIDMH